jgi:hypothetical protein
MTNPTGTYTFKYDPFRPKHLQIIVERNIRVCLRRGQFHKNVPEEFLLEKPSRLVSHQFNVVATSCDALANNLQN